ncbi:MAG: ABC transporter substrate-binding protein [Chloroflexi bacterium]|nr:ABC transporter substrate-binding protein [Chloroflexota bacterium]
MLALVRVWSMAVALLLMGALLVAACGTQPAPTSAPSKVEEVAPAKAASDKPATAPPAPKAAAPQVGGTLVWAVPAIAASLDPQSQGGVENAFPLNYLGSGLVTRDPQTGAVIPSLAESWKASEDGLTYEFKLKKNAKFHDGTPITAKDYVYTIQRHKDPALKSPTGTREWGAVASAEAPDDNTLILKLSKPDATFLFGKALTPARAQVLPKVAVENLGDKFATQPVLSGPFRLKELRTGLKVVLERNPDFQWGPAYHSESPYLQNLEFRQVKDYATILSGLEAGEIDLASVQAKDADRLKATGKVSILDYYNAIMHPAVYMNLSKAPWDDVRVRKAINLALDRQAMIKVAALGHGVEQKGPLPKWVYGYWPGAEQIGYGFDLNQAKALMKEAGYSPGSGGTLEKDGKPLKFVLKVNTHEGFNETVAQMVKEQFKALGIELDLQLAPRDETNADMIAGRYDLGIGYNATEPNGITLMRTMFHSSMMGTWNFSQVRDPKLDDLLTAAITTASEAKGLEYLADAQKLAVEKAYVVPLYTPKKFYALNNRFKGVTSNEYTFNWPVLTTAYTEGGR